MALINFSEDQLKEMSLIEVAYEILTERKEPTSFQDLLNELTTVLGLSQEEVRAKMAQFYTDLNIDGRFMALGENRWGLRVWYPVDQTEEEMATKTKAKKKKAKKVLEDDLGDFEELDDEEFDFANDEILDDEDDLDDFADDDDDELDDDDDFDDDFDDDLLDDDEEFDELDDDFIESDDDF